MYITKRVTRTLGFPLKEGIDKLQGIKHLLFQDNVEQAKTTYQNYKLKIPLLDQIVNLMFLEKSEEYQKILEHYKELKNYDDFEPLLSIFLHRIILRSYIELDQYDLGLALYEKIRSIYKRDGVEREISYHLLHFEMTCADLLWQKGDTKRAITKFEYCIRSASSIDATFIYAESNRLLGQIYAYQGKLGKALELFKISYETLVSSDLDYYHLVAYNLADLTIWSIWSFNIIDGINYGIKNLDNYEKIISKVPIIITLNWLGYANVLIGDDDKALNYLNQALEMNPDISIVQKSNTFIHLGNLYRDLNEIDKSLNYFQKALNIRKSIQTSIGDKIRLSNSLFQIAQVYLDVGKAAEAEKYYDEINEIAKEIDNYYVMQRLTIIKVRLLNLKGRMRHKIEAQNLLEDFLKQNRKVNRDVLYVEFLYLELLIEEFSLIQNEEILEDILVIIKRIEDQINVPDLIPQKIYLDLLKSRIYLIQGSISTTLEILHNSLEIAKSMNVLAVSELIQDEIDTFTNIYKNIESKSTQISTIELNEYLEELKMFMRNI